MSLKQYREALAQSSQRGDTIRMLHQKYHALQEEYNRLNKGLEDELASMEKEHLEKAQCDLAEIRSLYQQLADLSSEKEHLQGLVRDLCSAQANPELQDSSDGKLQDSSDGELQASSDGNLQDSSDGKLQAAVKENNHLASLLTAANKDCDKFRCQLEELRGH